MQTPAVVQKSAITFRLTEEQVARLEALMGALSTRAAGVPMTRAMVARLVIDKGLQALEAELATKPRKG